MCKEAIVILGHGSRRQEANSEISAIAQLLQQRHTEYFVKVAYAEFATPTLSEITEELALSGYKRIIIVPLFLTIGTHIYKDLPRQIAVLKEKYPDIVFKEARHLGADLFIVQLIEKRIREADEEV